MPLAKASKETLLRGGYCRDRYRDHSNGILQSGSTLNIAWARGNLWPKSRVGISGWTITQRKHQELG